MLYRSNTAGFYHRTVQLKKSDELRIHHRKARVRSDSDRYSDTLQVSQQDRPDGQRTDLRRYDVQPQLEWLVVDREATERQLDSCPTDGRYYRRYEPLTAVARCSGKGTRESRLGRGLSEGYRPLRHGIAVQGHRQEQPGRDPQVHHQGADFEIDLGRLGARRAGSIRGFLIALLFFLFPACDSTARRADAPDWDPSSEDATLSYHDPTPRRGQFQQGRGARGPVTLVLTADSDFKEADSGSASVLVLKGPLGGNAGRDTDRQVLDILKQTVERNPTKTVSRDRLAEIWQSMIDAGILELPRLPSGSPSPTGTPWFAFEFNGEQWVFTRPDSSFQGQSTERDDRKRKAWQRCVVIMQTSY
jgi:hypothetical protein